MLEDIASQFHDELRRGERLLWTGRPGQGLMLRRSDAFDIPVSLVWAAVAFTFFISETRSGPFTWVRVLSILFLLIAVYILIGRFLVNMWLRTRTYYAVTDQRAMILWTVGDRAVQVMDPPALAKMRLRAKDDDTGTITFEGTRAVRSWGARISWGDWESGSSTPSPWAAFEGIDDARHVYDLLTALHSGEGHVRTS